MTDSQECESALRAALTCFMCSKIADLPMQCAHGHIICDNCVAELYMVRGGCPKCQIVSVWSLNRVLLNIATEYKLSIRCGIHECTARHNIDKIRTHRLHCNCQRFECPVQPQECEEFRASELATHVCHHRSTFQVAADDCLTIINFSCRYDVVFVFNKRVICVRMEGSNVLRNDSKIRAGVIGTGSNIKLHLTNRDTTGIDAETSEVSLYPVQSIDRMPIIFTPRLYGSVLHSSTPPVTKCMISKISPTSLQVREMLQKDGYSVIHDKPVYMRGDWEGAYETSFITLKCVADGTGDVTTSV